MTLPERVRDVLMEKLSELVRTHDKNIDLSTVHFSVERPKRPEHGDYATNAAMVLTKSLGVPPRAIADALAKSLANDAMIASAHVAGPGFVNLRLHPRALCDEVKEIIRDGRGYGRAPSGTGERIDLEFVSANPTGPLLVSHARGAVVGDALGRVLEAAGHRVVREYYINDFGNQVRLFAESVAAVAEGRPVPEDGYKGEYIRDIAASLDRTTLEGDRAALARTCVTLMLRDIKKTLARLRVHFDVWFSEESLHRWGAVALALKSLQDGGFLENKDGALFFVARGGSEDKDRVVKKSDGDFTYFASDIAYHADKIARGYDRLIDVLGADHHGYVTRIKNVLEALGLPSEKFETLLFQLVFVKRGEELVKFSKRAGNIVTADELIEEIDASAGAPGAGADAIRFFYLLRSHTTNVDFDVELAKKKSLDNPVFYVQYGHARLCSILRHASELGYAPGGDLGRLEEDELVIVRLLADFPQLVRIAAAQREPHRVAFYVSELARAFQSYYTRKKNDPILPSEGTRRAGGWEKRWDHEKTRARLAWVRAIQIVYASALDLCGVSAPARMERPEGEGEPS
jgi:arginyl-tRNA synthetase